jgi:hypothetical protein
MAVHFGRLFNALHRAKRRAARPRKAVVMTEENKVDVTVPDDPAQDDGKDYKAMYEQAIAESRKWESRSKSNADKAKQFDELQDANKTLEERVASIEAANKALEDEKARSNRSKAISNETGIPNDMVSAVLSATDEDEMTAAFKAIVEYYKTPGGAPKVPEAGKFPNGKAEPDEKRKFVRDLLGN